MIGNVVSVKHRGDKFIEPWMVLMCTDMEPERFTRYHLVAETEVFTSKDIYESARSFDVRHGRGEIWKMLMAYAALVEATEMSTPQDGGRSDQTSKEE